MVKIKLKRKTIFKKWIEYIKKERYTLLLTKPSKNNYFKQYYLLNKFKHHCNLNYQS